MGGSHPDFSCMSRKSRTEIPELSPDKLAQVHAFTVIKPIDTSGGAYAIQHIPRRRVVDAVSELQELSDLLLACVRANHGVPPICIAMDAHESFTMVHSWVLGVLPAENYRDMDVLRDCQPSSPWKLPCFGFKMMLHVPSQRPIFGCVDPKHVLKAWARSIRSPSRIVKM